MGIAGGSLALIHSITGLFVHMRGNMWQYFSVQTATGYKIRLDDFGVANYTGLLSALLVVALLITSNDYFILKLRATKWKNIQRLSYLMFILAIIHIIYYRLNNLGLVYSFYLPMVACVLALQISGYTIRIKNKNASGFGEINTGIKDIG
jgi:sulfoxide reductase heme-binding subunit YedZ